MTTYRVKKPPKWTAGLFGLMLVACGGFVMSLATGSIVWPGAEMNAPPIVLFGVGLAFAAAGLTVIFERVFRAPDAVAWTLRVIVAAFAVLAGAIALGPAGGRGGIPLSMLSRETASQINSVLFRTLAAIIAIVLGVGAAQPLAAAVVARWRGRAKS